MWNELKVRKAMKSAEDHGLGAEVKRIKLHTSCKEQRPLRRAMVAELLHDHQLLEKYIREIWQFGGTEDGGKMIEKYLNVAREWKKKYHRVWSDTVADANDDANQTAPNVLRLKKEKELYDLSAEDIWECRKLFKHKIDEILSNSAARGAKLDCDDLFEWYAVNLLSPMVGYEGAEKAVGSLKTRGLLFRGDAGDVQEGLKGKYRFPPKAKWLVQARKKFYDQTSVESIKQLMLNLANIPSVYERRQHFIDQVPKGFSLKTASHYLRGVNLSNNQLAILDRQVMKLLVRVPQLRLKECKLAQFNEKGQLQHPGKGKYLEIEARVKNWAEKIVRIPLDELDLILWRMGRSVTKDSDLAS
jgi:thermostable 8-oxoguanine DNA glycosylase